MCLQPIFSPLWRHILDERDAAQAEPTNQQYASIPRIHSCVSNQFFPPYGDIYWMRGMLHRQNPLINNTPQFLGFTHVSPTNFFPLVGLVLIYDTTSPMD